MPRDLLLYGDPVLRRKAEPVREITDDIRELVREMKRIMYEERGVGLAAPQVGALQRVFVLDVPGDDNAAPTRLTAINPVIVAAHGESNEEEGCLSIPGIRERVRRPERIVAEALDLDGRRYTIEAGDLLSRAFQHELDHLDGVLFVDRLPSVRRSLLARRLADIAAGKVPKDSLTRTE
jgi:peptide deformylase